MLKNMMNSQTRTINLKHKCFNFSCAVVIAMLVILTMTLSHQTYSRCINPETKDDDSLLQERNSNINSKKGNGNVTSKTDNQNTDDRKTDVVILLTMTRSGSSIVGSIFNERENVLYLYEPLFPFGMQECDEKTRESSLKVLQSITSCHFENLQSLYRPSTRNDIYAGCQKFHVCFAGLPGKTSKFMSRDTDICKTVKGNQACPRPLDPNRLNKHCNKTLVAMKVNYLCKLEWLLPLLEDMDYNVKVVHLVRDPRLTISSRIESDNTIVMREIKNVCGRLATNLNFTETEVFNSLNLQKKYMRIRYEDFVLNPLGKTLQIYNFVGIEMNMHIKRWLDDAMSTTNSKDLSKTSPFGLKRNVMSALNGWKTKLSFDDIKAIQKGCEWTLKKLKYKIYDNEAELKDMDDIHFVPKW